MIRKPTGRMGLSGGSWVVSWSVAGTLFACLVPSAWAYNFTFFGGRLDRAGVTTGPAGTNDFLYSWAEPDHGTLTWYLDRGELKSEDCDLTCFTALQGRVQPELNKWALWIRQDFVVAASADSAEVLIRFMVKDGKPVAADAGPLEHIGTTLTKARIRINPDYQDWTTEAGQKEFSFLILHESGHVLGLGDLYRVNHGDATFEGEDFCDHGLPSGRPPAGAPGLPDTRTKGDNVMQSGTPRATVPDNDSIHGVEWLWGNSGSNGIVTGDLQFRTGLNNANKAAAHHGLTQTPMTWTYRGSVASFLNAPKVTLFFSGILAARDVGPGNWTRTIFPNRVEFEHAGPWQEWESNFKFEVDCNQGPERYGNAIVAGAVATNFEATPAGGGPQLFPFDQVFGADCQENKELDYFPMSSATVTINIPGVGSEDITLTGPTKVVVALGKLGDQDGDGLEEVPTQIVDMELTGISALLGPVIVKVRPWTVKPFQPSTGQIVEKSNDTPGVLDLPPFTPTGCAFSYFDVFFEIYAAGEIYHNQEPKRMEAQITYKPPGKGETYESPTPIELFDENSNPTGIVIKSVRHTPRTPTVSEWGMVAIILLLSTGISIKFRRRRGSGKAA